MNFKILSIDYGCKRTGLAISDTFQMIASGLRTIKTKNLMTFLNSYIYEENIQKVIIGEPKNCKNRYSIIEKEIQKFIIHFCINFPEIHLDRINEIFTSKLAKKNLISIKKRDRYNKFILDKISATIILQSYLNKR